jgi:hypothetical protein
MLKRLLVLYALMALAGVSAQSASANQTNAPDALAVTIVCSNQQYLLAVNGNGTFTPGHVIGESREFVPTAFDLTYSFTDTSGTVDTQTASATKPNPPTSRPIVTCDIPASLNTTAEPNGTLVVTGSVTGFLAH